MENYLLWMENALKPIVVEFLAFMVKKIGITNPYKIKLSVNRTEDFKTYAYYVPSSGLVCVYIKDRGCADVLRSLSHELVHHFQNQNGRLNTQESIPDIGGPIEDEANAVAGQLVKEFGYLISKKGINIYE